MFLDDYFTVLQQFLEAQFGIVRFTSFLVLLSIYAVWEEAEEEDTTFDNFLNDGHEKTAEQSTK